MIDKLSLSAEWINLKQTEFKKDPSLIESITNISTFKGLGATSLLILVGVAIDTSKQVQTYLISKNYENILR
jgi:preprotein translocase subunit SecY